MAAIALTFFFELLYLCDPRRTAPTTWSEEADLSVHLSHRKVCVLIRG
jgi:hypothetical protein